MIKSKNDYLFYLEADRVARSLPKTINWSLKLRNLLFPDPVWEFQKMLRKYEYYKNCKTGFIYKLHILLIARRFKKISYKLGFTIPTNVFGPGLSIAHYGTIVINDGVQVGANCRIHTCVNIGTEAGYRDRAPRIGDNCYIGPGAKIFGDIMICNNVAIGANALVNRSFSESNIAIGGIPARKISDVNIYDIIIPATEVVLRGLNKNEIAGLPATELHRLLREIDQ